MLPRIISYSSVRGGKAELAATPRPSGRIWWTPAASPAGIKASRRKLHLLRVDGHNLESRPVQEQVQFPSAKPGPAWENPKRREEVQ